MSDVIPLLLLSVSSVLAGRTTYIRVLPATTIFIRQPQTLQPQCKFACNSHCNRSSMVSCCTYLRHEDEGLLHSHYGAYEFEPIVSVHTDAIVPYPCLHFDVLFGTRNNGESVLHCSSRSYTKYGQHTNQIRSRNYGEV